MTASGRTGHDREFARKAKQEAKRRRRERARKPEELPADLGQMARVALNSQSIARLRMTLVV